MDREPRPAREVPSFNSQSRPEMVKPHPVNSEAHLGRAKTHDFLRVWVKVLLFANRHFTPKVHPQLPIRINHSQRDDRMGAIQFPTEKLRLL